MKILDIGCGNNKYVPSNTTDKVVGLDVVKLPGVDVVHDLNKIPWPIQANTFDTIIANHILEHVDDLVKTMDELWRISKPGARVKILVPYHTSLGAFTDPTHKRFFTLRTLDFFSVKERAGVAPFYTKRKFYIQFRELRFGRVKFLGWIFSRIPRIYENFFRFLIPAPEAYFELVPAKKD